MLRKIQQRLSQNDITFGCLCSLISLKLTHVDKNPEDENIIDQFNHALWYFCIGVIANTLITKISSSLFKKEDEMDKILRLYELQPKQIKKFMKNVELKYLDGIQRHFEKLNLKQKLGLIRYLYRYLEESLKEYLTYIENHPNAEKIELHKFLDKHGKPDPIKIALTLPTYSSSFGTIEEVMDYVKNPATFIPNFIPNLERSIKRDAVIGLFYNILPPEISELIASYLSYAYVGNVTLVRKAAAYYAFTAFNEVLADLKQEGLNDEHIRFFVSPRKVIPMNDQQYQNQNNNQTLRF